MPQDNSVAKIVLVLFLASGAFLYLAFSPDGGEQKELHSKSPVQLSPHSPEVERVVNQRLKEVNTEVERQRLYGKINNMAFAPKVGDVLIPKPKKKESTASIDFDEDQKYNQLKKDLLDRQYRDKTPSAVVQEDLLKKRQREEIEKKEREEYIRQFIQNARREGWNIKVDKNGVIIRADPIDVEPEDDEEGPVNIFE